MKPGAAGVSQPLLGGHLSFCRTLLRSSGVDKVAIGDMLVVGIVDVLLFSASMRTVRVRQEGVVVEAGDDNIHPLCSASPARVAAFDLLIEVCLHCGPNFEKVVAALAQLHTVAIGKFVAFFC